MKKLILLAVTTVFLFTGCVELAEMSFYPGEENLTGVDFRKYTNKGFLVTPEKYLGNYESIGLLTYELIPASSYRKTGRQINENHIAGSTSGGPQFYDIYKWIDQDVDVQMALDSLVNICIDDGADALMNLKREFIFREHTGVKNPHTVIGVSISGFAIKRK
jgi:hypothetical protein